MITRMAPVRFVSLEDFKGRRLLPGEPLLVFLHVLKQLLEQAMPEADAATRKQLHIHQFLTGLPMHVSRQQLAAGDNDDLDKVLGRAKLLLTIEEQGRTTAAVDTAIYTSRSRGIEGAGISTHRASSSIGYVHGVQLPDQPRHVCVIVATSQVICSEFCPDLKAVFLVWAVWTPRKYKDLFRASPGHTNLVEHFIDPNVRHSCESASKEDSSQLSS